MKIYRPLVISKTFQNFKFKDYKKCDINFKFNDYEKCGILYKK